MSKESIRLPDPFSLFSDLGISRETFSRLSIYHDLLKKWQAKINLVSADSMLDVWRRHFLDSAQLLRCFDDLSKTIVDLGTGAGFPGMVLAICGAGNVHLIESDAKKISFLKEVARQTNTQVLIHHNRIEDRPVEKADILVSRACSQLQQLFELSLPYVSHETTGLFHKGKNYSKEILDAKKNWWFDCDALSSMVSDEGVILRISNLRKSI